jgi:hypothetical protein
MTAEQGKKKLFPTAFTILVLITFVGHPGRVVSAGRLTMMRMVRPPGTYLPVEESR